MLASPLLDCRGVAVWFGGVRALEDVDFSVARGAIAAIIGPNGAGKTTLLNAITGLVTARAGEMTLQGADISRLAPHKRGRAGVVRTFQNLEVFSNMTVLENVLTGRHRLVRYNFFDALARTPRFRRQERIAREQAMAMLEFVGLADKADTPAGDLAFGGQRLLELARALAAEPLLLLLDEPAAGLNMKETRSLARLIRRVRDELGVTVALVEHDMGVVMDISDEITVLHFGRLLCKGTPADIQRNPEVVAAYLGEEE